jgi:hypothetical protein
MKALQKEKKEMNVHYVLELQKVSKRYPRLFLVRKDLVIWKV